MRGENKSGVALPILILYGVVTCVSAFSLPRIPFYDVVIVGGSVSGLSTAVGLRNEKVCLIEKASSFQKIGALLALFPNGITALEALSPDLKKSVMSSCIKLKATQLMDLKNQLVKESPATETTNSHFLLWYELQEKLRNYLPDGVDVKLGSTFLAAREHDGGLDVMYRDESTGQELQISCRVLVGADGVHSQVRNLVSSEPALEFHNRTIFRGIISDRLLVTPPLGVAVTWRGGSHGKFFKIWNANGKLVFTAAYSTTMANNLTDVEANADLLRRTFREYPIGVDRIRAEEIYTNHVCDHDLLSAEDWSKGNIILIGDAAHAMVPALGQGGNLALEDGCELAGALSKALSKTNTNIPLLLDQFSCQRHGRISLIHQASREHTRNKRERKQEPLAEFMANKRELYEEIYSWKPSMW